MAMVTVRNGYAKTVCRVTTFSGDKPWMKHGTDNRVVDRKLEEVNALAHQSKSHVWGVLRRHNGKLSVAKVTP